MNCVRLIWRLRRKQQIKKETQPEENKKNYTTQQYSVKEKNGTSRYI